MTTRRGIHTLLAVVLLGAGWSALPADSVLGSFRDWTAMRYGDGRDAQCMAFTQPLKSEGDYSRRGDAFLFVTRRPATAERGRISLDTGYPYKAGSTASVSVDDVHLELPTRGSTAWVADDDDARTLIAAMRSGKALRVRGTSSRGTVTLDHYSLYGFTAAHRAISGACAM